MEREIIENIANNLRTLRKERGLTQKQLIDQIGEEQLSLRSYKSYESKNSTRVPLLEKVSLLADYFGVTLDFLVNNKRSTLDDSFTKRDALRRLNRLIYSGVILPVRQTDIEPTNLGRFVLLYNKDDLDVYLEQLYSLSSVKNIEFRQKKKLILSLLPDFDALVEQMTNLDDDLTISMERLDSLVKQY